MTTILEPSIFASVKYLLLQSVNVLNMDEGKFPVQRFVRNIEPFIASLQNVRGNLFSWCTREVVYGYVIVVRSASRYNHTVVAV